jgi:hypothetical protein
MLIKPLGAARSMRAGLVRQSSGVVSLGGSPEAGKMYYNAELQR